MNRSSGFMKQRATAPPYNAFTLLELAVTVAVLSILTLVTVPIAQNAITYSRIASTQNNLRIVRDGLEIHAQETNHYPMGSSSPSNSLFSDFDACIALKSLLGTYLPADNSLLEDDFSRETMIEIKKSVALDPNTIPHVIGYTYFDYTHYHVPPWTPLHAFALVSVGPDAKDSGLGIGFRNLLMRQNTLYAPSNGIRSAGDIGISNVSCQ